MSEQQKPSVGRAVHYVPLKDLPPVYAPEDQLFQQPAGHWAATITAVVATPAADSREPQSWIAANGNEPQVWLTVFPPGEDPRAFAIPVRYSAQPTEGTWHWPEYVG